MRIVFELASDPDGAIYVVDVKTVDDKMLVSDYRGALRSFPISDVRGATTVSGRPFSLRPYDVEKVKVAG
ncbi:hypothetical protein [Pararhizobium arenae]|uniref:hypothetical protein n=1 Tax=Pararhizobium arenae TaxID=1856850 RepID=UPI00094B6F3C|nr:hypothetical protein [Pararhizobium arenae]